MHPHPRCRSAIAALALTLAGCSTPRKDAAAAPPVQLPAGFAERWGDGRAEIAVYDLQQSRYGETRPGRASLIFVTEPFSQSQQVKLDRPGLAGTDRVEVLKLNLTKKFVTGVYPYSLMTSVFSPIGEGKSRAVFKATFSAQEWCGHTYTQINRTPGGLRALWRSYFQSEGDGERALPPVLIEDELWALIRTAPDALPSGRMRILPAMEHLRLRHHPTEPVEADIVIADDGEGRTLSVDYTRPEPRRLTIRFDRAFPHRILGWEERIRPAEGVELITSARLLKVERQDYWNRNKLADAPLRARLQLDLP